MTKWAWLDDAACRSSPDWDEQSDWQRLLDICAECPVREPCRVEAERLGIGGVRGGTLPRQRGWRNQVPPRGWSSEPWTTMRDGRPDPGVDPFGGLFDWLVEHGAADGVVSIQPQLADYRSPKLTSSPLRAASA